MYQGTSVKVSTHLVRGNMLKITKQKSLLHQVLRNFYFKLWPFKDHRTNWRETFTEYNYCYWLGTIWHLVQLSTCIKIEMAVFSNMNSMSYFINIKFYKIWGNKKRLFWYFKLVLSGQICANIYWMWLATYTIGIKWSKVGLVIFRDIRRWSYFYLKRSDWSKEIKPKNELKKPISMVNHHKTHMCSV